MQLKNSTNRILQEFFDFPRKEFHMREISRRVKLAQPSVILHLKALLQEKYIIKEKKGIYPTFRANREFEKFKLLKKMNIVLRIQESGLLSYLYDSCLPEAIILFGSAAWGEDTEESDLDIFLACSSQNLQLEKYEKILNRKINVFFEKDISRLSAELKNNILNGVILKGYLKVF